MEPIRYQPPTDAEYRSLRYRIHRNVHGRSASEATKHAEEDLKQWREEQHRLAAEAKRVAA